MVLNNHTQSDHPPFLGIQSTGSLEGTGSNLSVGREFPWVSVETLGSLAGPWGTELILLEKVGHTHDKKSWKTPDTLY